MRAKVLMEPGGEPFGVDPIGRRDVAEFTIRAKKVILAAGVMNTPTILHRSGINPRGRVGASLYVHLTGGVVARIQHRQPLAQQRRAPGILRHDQGAVQERLGQVFIDEVFTVGIVIKAGVVPS